MRVREQKRKHTHDRGLLLIGLFKLGKSILFFGIGVGAIHLLHKDLGDVVMRVAMALKFDPESRFVTHACSTRPTSSTHIGSSRSAPRTFGYSARCA